MRNVSHLMRAYRLSSPESANAIDRGLRLFAVVATIAFLSGVAQVWAAPESHPPGDRVQSWAVGDIAPQPANVQSYNNQTIREIIHTSIGGDQIRVRIANTFGSSPLVIGEAHVAVSSGGAAIATGTDRTTLFKAGAQWTHLFGSSVEGNINGAFVQSFATHSGIVATVTGDGLITPTTGNQSWFEYGGRLGFRIAQGWVADLFVNGTLGPQPVGNTIHGGLGLRVNY